MRYFFLLLLFTSVVVCLCLPSTDVGQIEELTKQRQSLFNHPLQDAFYTTNPENPERERRDEGVYPFLTPSIGTEGRTSCSGTIVYYDARQATAYTLACAHCYRINERPKVRTYFVDGKREIREFPGTIVAINADEDLAVITFHPDFVPNWIPIGPKDCQYYRPTEAPVGRRVVVTGRDAGLPDKDRRPAAYEAFIREDDNDRYLESRQSQSRGGRSGGGVMTTNCQWLIGVNHGRTSTKEGVGHGMWVPLHRIHKFLEDNDLEWLGEVSELYRKIPIVNKTNKKYPDGYIPRFVPNNQYWPLDGGEIMPPVVSVQFEINPKCGCSQPTS